MNLYQEVKIIYNLIAETGVPNVGGGVTDGINGELNKAIETTINAAIKTGIDIAQNVAKINEEGLTFIKTGAEAIVKGVFDSITAFDKAAKSINITLPKIQKEGDNIVQGFQGIANILQQSIANLASTIGEIEKAKLNFLQNVGKSVNNSITNATNDQFKNLQYNSSSQ